MAFVPQPGVTTLDASDTPDEGTGTGEIIPPEEDTPVTPGPQIFDMKALGTAIADGINATQRRKVTYGQYKPVSAQQPDKTRMHKLTRVCYQNGGRMDPSRLTNEEIDLLNRLHRSGRYCDRIIEVIIGRDGSEDAVDIRYHNKSNDQKMEIQKLAGRKGLVGILEQIVEEQDALDDQDEQRNARPLDTRPAVADTAQRRPFGRGKATQEARQRAGA